MYGKNPNHANKFRRFFNKKYPPGSRFVVYSAISAGCIGPPAGGYIGRPAGFPCPCRGPDEKTVRRCSAMVRVLRKSGSGHARGPTESISEYSGHPPVGAFWNIRDPLLSGRSGCSEALRTGRSGAARPVGSFADGSDADRAAAGCGYLISRSGCSRRKCSQLCDPLREAAFLPPPSPLTRSGPRAAWSGLEVV